MEFNPSNFVSINEVLADILVLVNDEEQDKLTPGFYRAQVKYALDELGFEAPFYEAPPVDIALPDNLIVDYPVGCYNLKQIHVYSGTPDNVQFLQNVYWKKGGHSRGKGTGLTADSHPWTFWDPYCKVQLSNHLFWRYYFTVHNGRITLSDSCANFDYVRMIFDGIPSKHLDNIKMIPPEVRHAVMLWAAKRCLTFLFNKERGLSVPLQMVTKDLDEFGLDGAWHQAKNRIRNLDKKLWRDTIEYNSKLNE
jgi:hypothetical protein